MKKILALVMTATMLLALASVAFAAAPEGQIAYYEFNEGETGLTVNGENVTYADGAATLGDATYFTADIDLANVTEMTIAMKVKTTDTDANWGFEITSEEAHTYPVENYIGILLNAGITVERYSNPAEKNARPGAATVAELTANEWNEIVCVFPADGSIVVYVNGVEAATFAQPEGYDLAIQNCIGENPVFQIGKANWGEGEFANGTSFDTFAVYNKALTAEQVATAFEKAEAPETGAPQTGIATIALAVVAMLSGAYIVSKKH